ncbi:penicillin-binding protein, partial [Occultella aeris]|uniref:penicillin-binding protein n=2 Tax=Occultella aeris TaxID=2761496 RepID=UPI0018D2E911
MAPPSRSTSRAVNAAQLVSLFLAFLLVAGVGGVLSAGFMMPFVTAVGATTDASTRLFDELPTELGSEELSEQTVMNASDGTRLATFFLENRIVVPLSEINPYMGAAVIAVEDQRYYEHGGVDPEGLIRAAVQTLTGGGLQGGSTLTQQYVKNVLIEAGRNANDPEAIEAARESTIGRKLREAKLAIALEQVRTKDEILEGYLNIAQFGPSQYGVEAAAQYFFSRSAAELTLGQSAMLARITQNPAKWNPVNNPEVAEAGRNTVLGLMLSQGKITQEEHDAAVAQPIADMMLVSNTPVGCSNAGTAAYFCDYVKSEILNNPVFGETQAERYQLLVRGGLTINTTINLSMQAQAYASLIDAIPVDDPSGVSTAVSTVQPNTGQILAMAQNTLYGKPAEGASRTTEVNFNADTRFGGSSGFQTGSTFKAFVLTQWLIDGHSLNDRVDGSTGQSFPRNTWETCLPEYISSDPYEPRNLEGIGTGPMSVLSATEESVNTAFVNMANQMNLCDLTNTAQSMGVHHATLAPGGTFDNGFALNVVPSMALGANEIAPLTMAAAFATYASGGVYCEPIAILSIQNSDGEELPVPPQTCSQALQPNIANAMNYALGQVVADGTGRPSQLGDRPSAGKTGTANDDSAAWFVGYVPRLASAVWVGFSEGTESMQNITINGRYYQYVYGGAMAAPIWQNYMSQAVQGLPVEGFAAAGDREIYGERRPVPNVGGRSVADATSILEGAGFTVRTGATENHDTVPAGSVIGTNPGAGSLVTPGSGVTIVISGGPAPAPPATPDPGDTGGGEGGGGPGNGGGNG